jgi:soluble lytic murein transglycosylase-like protein
VARLVALNDIVDPNRIYPGQRIRLAAAPRPVHRRSASVIHRVAYGETLTGVAARYRTTVEALARRNRLADPSRIYAGQLLRISAGRSRRGVVGASAPSTHQPAFPTHLVRAGETLTAIAARYRVSMESIADANRLANTSFIRTGQALRIPAHAAPSRDRTLERPGSSVRMPAQMASLVAQRGAIRRIIVAEARRQGVPAAFALAVAWQESGWQPHVVSSAGAIGVMQLLPATADWVSATMLGEAVDLKDAHSNVRAGVSLLRHYLARYRGDRSLALAAYYQGQAGTDRHGIYPVSRPYIASILLLQRMFTG